MDSPPPIAQLPLQSAPFIPNSPLLEGGIYGVKYYTDNGFSFRKTIPPQQYQSKGYRGNSKNYATSNNTIIQTQPKPRRPFAANGQQRGPRGAFAEIVSRKSPANN